MATTISAVSPPPSTAWRSCICSSSRVDMAAGIGELLRMPRLVQKNFERGEVGVPLDQRRHRAEALERRGVEVPYGFGNSGAVIVDQDIDIFGSVMTGKMDLADRLDRQRIEIGDRIEPEIPRANVDVVHITEDAAAGPANNLGQKLRLG